MMLNTYNLKRNRKVRKVKKQFAIRCVSCRCEKFIFFDMDTYHQGQLFHGKVYYCANCAKNGRQEMVSCL